MKYSQERKEAVLKKMLAPDNQSIAELAKAESISEATLYNWHVEPVQHQLPRAKQKFISNMLDALIKQQQASQR